MLPNPPNRGSDFGGTLKSVGTVPAGVTMAYSGSTNPTRPEVYPGAPDAVDDWGSDPVGARALRMRLDGPLAPGESKRLEFAIAVDPGTVGERTCNGVAVDSTQTLPAEPRAVCATLAEADLAVELASLSTLQAGRPGRFAFDVTNLGPTTPAPASVELEVPEGLTVTDLTISGWSCVVEGGGSAPVAGPATLLCDPVDDAGQKEDLVKDTTTRLAFPVAVDPSVADEVCIAAGVSGTLHDPVLGNNADAGCREVAPTTAGLSLEKDDGVEVVKVGAQTTYTITVANTLVGETIADVVVTDTLPAGLEFVSASHGGSESGGTVTWALGELGPEEETSVELTVRVTDAAESPLVNEAGAAAPDPADPSETLAADGEDSDVVRSLSITKTSDAPAIPKPGTVVGYTVTLTNDGPGDYTDAESAALVDDLSGVLDDAAYNDDAEASVGGTPVEAPVVDGEELTWSGPLAAGESVVVTYSVTIGADGDGDVTNTACVPLGQASTGADRCVVESFTIPEPADLAIELTSLDLLQAGRPGRFAFAVTNLGPNTPAPASVELEVPAELTVTDLDVSGWSCAVEGGGSAPVAGPAILLCDPVDDADEKQDLVQDTPTRLAFPVRVAASITDEVCVAAEVTGTLHDPVSDNNTDAGCRAVAPATAGLSLEKDDGIEVTKVGAETSYTITVANTLIDETIADAVVTDTLPAGLEFVSASHGGTESGGVVTWELDDLAPGASVERQLTVRVTDAAASPLVNEAAVAAPDPADPSETFAADGEDSNTVRSLSIVKTSDATDPAALGEKVTYTVTLTNDGPGDYTDAEPAVLVDDLSGVLDDAAYNDDAEASVEGTPVEDPVVDGEELTWSGPLAEGESVVVTYSVTIGEEPEGDGDVTNVACVPVGQASTGAERCVEESFAIEGPADLAIELTSLDPLEAGQPGRFAYDVTNLGPNAPAPATVTLDIPEGLTVTDLEISGWSCVVEGGGDAPVEGPATLLCEHAGDGGAGIGAADLDLNTPTSLAVPVAVAGSVTDEVCVAAEVTGTLHDPVSDNNTDAGCREVRPTDEPTDPPTTSPTPTPTPTPTASATPSPSASPSPGSGNLPDTGAPVSLWALLVALAALGAGAGLVVYGRRRRGGV